MFEQNFDQSILEQRGPEEVFYNDNSSVLGVDQKPFAHPDPSRGESHWKLLILGGGCQASSPSARFDFRQQRC